MLNKYVKASDDRLCVGIHKGEATRRSNIYFNPRQKPLFKFFGMNFKSCFICAVPVFKQSITQSLQTTMATEVECRICFNSGTMNEMIAPCRCNGPLRFVHSECLDDWRKLGPNNYNVTHCPNCNFAYHLQHRNYTGTESFAMKHPLLVALGWLTLQWLGGIVVAGFLGGFIAKYGTITRH